MFGADHERARSSTERDFFSVQVPGALNVDTPTALLRTRTRRGEWMRTCDRSEGYVRRRQQKRAGGGIAPSPVVRADTKQGALLLWLQADGHKTRKEGRRKRLLLYMCVQIDTKQNTPTAPPITAKTHDPAASESPTGTPHRSVRT